MFIAFQKATASLVLFLSVARAAPPGFVDELVTLTGSFGLTNSGAFATASTGDTLLFLGSKNGPLNVIINPDDDPENKVTLMNLPVCNNGERGIQTILPHPDFESNGFLYIYRTEFREGCERDGVLGPHNRLSRFTVSFDVDSTPFIETSSELSLFRGPTQVWVTHNGGGMAFGNDGNIYITIGDGGLTSYKNGQNRQTLNGAVLRITDVGDVPLDNPYAAEGVRCNETGVVPEGDDAVCSEIFAIGMRNPYRLAMDPNTKGKVRFYIGDVGGKKWEELNECGTDYKGANFGWELREGPCKRDSDTDCQEVAGLQDPIYWYAHNRFESGGAITGGAFVPNGFWPDSYNDTYLFADLVFSNIYELRQGGTNCRACNPPTSKFTNSTFHAANGVVDMFFGPHKGSQALYYLTLFDGNVRRIRYTGSDTVPPTALIKVSRSAAGPGQAIQFNASESFDPDGDLLSYHWDFSDGTSSTDIAPLHTFHRRKEYQVRLSVKDERGFEAVAFQSIIIGEVPMVSIDSPRDGTTFAVGDMLTLRGRAWFVNGDGKRIFLHDLVWEVRQHHADHWHPFLAPTAGNDITIDPAPPPEDYVAATNSFLRVILTGYDLDGISFTVTRDIMPRLSYLDFDSEPTGLQLSVDGSLVTMPARVLSWENHNMQVSIEDQDGYTFDSWSNEMIRTHFIRLPVADSPIPKYTALFDRRAPLMIPLVEPIRDDCSPSNPCGQCEGHCRRDNDCKEGLICFYKDMGVEGVDSVPGCSGHDLSFTDWCTVGVRKDTDPIPLSKPIKKFCSEEVSCGRCEGHCFDDGDCEGDLVCFEKDEGLPGVDAVPGCLGEDLSQTDWCTTQSAIDLSKSTIPLVEPIRDDCSPFSPCGQCEGHCRQDNDCEEGLICFYKDMGVEGVDSVPGCSGHDLSFTDWCIVGVRKDTDPIPLSKPIKKFCSEEEPCNRCEGHCFDDGDCEGDLVCFEKDGGLPGVVPGCLGESLSQTDWCTTQSAIDLSSSTPLVSPVRNNCSPSNPCGQCEGHCRRDNDCEEGLICFYKDMGVEGVDSVPGCSGHDLSFTDWCTVGVRKDTDSIPLSKPVKKYCSEEEPCGRCEGHCFDDGDCEGDLVCFEKDEGLPGVDAVPGCLGEDLSQTDWCTTQSAIDLSKSTIPLVKPIRDDCSPSHPCGQCEGHCRRDNDCEEDLVCFYKDMGVEGVDSVPGCSGHDLSFTDWCTVGVRKDTDPIPLSKPIKKFCSEEEPCSRCEGHCFDDGDCEGDLVCFEKDEGLPGVDAVPGCLGEDLSRTNWCTNSVAISDSQVALGPVRALRGSITG